MKLRKTFAVLVAVCVFAALAVTVSAANVTYYSVDAGDEISGAMIDASGLENGKTYTVKFNVTLTEDNFSGGIRVRLSEEDAYGPWADDAGNNSSDDGTYLPALFDGMDAGETYDLSVMFEYGAEVEGVDWSKANFIGIVGLQGDHGLVVNSADIIEGSLITPIAAPAPAPAAGDTTAATPEKGTPATGVASVATVAGIAVLAGAGIVLSVKKRK